MSILTTIEVVIITILSLYPILGAMVWFWGAMAYVIFRRKDELKPDQKLDHSLLSRLWCRLTMKKSSLRVR